MTLEEQNYPPEKPDPGLNATEGQRRLGGVTGKGFMPGRSGNPKGLNGRPKGLAAMVRRQTKDGTEIVRLMYRILKGRKFRRTISTQSGQQTDILVRPTIGTGTRPLCGWQSGAGARQRMISRSRGRRAGRS